MRYKSGSLNNGGYASRDTPTNQALPLINHPLREEGLPTTKQTLSHIDILQKRIVNGVFYYPAFLEGGNNDPANALVLEVNGSREVIPIPGNSSCASTNLKWKSRVVIIV